VAPEHRHGVRRRAAARLLRVGHVLRPVWQLWGKGVGI
jgi:hypothetical protein